MMELWYPHVAVRKTLKYRTVQVYISNNEVFYKLNIKFRKYFVIVRCLKYFVVKVFVKFFIYNFNYYLHFVIKMLTSFTNNMLHSIRISYYIISRVYLNVKYLKIFTTRFMVYNGIYVIYRLLFVGFVTKYLKYKCFNFNLTLLLQFFFKNRFQYVNFFATLAYVNFITLISQLTFYLCSIVQFTLKYIYYSLNSNNKQNVN